MSISSIPNPNATPDSPNVLEEERRRLGARQDLQMLVPAKRDSLQELWRTLSMAHPIPRHTAQQIRRLDVPR